MTATKTGARSRAPVARSEVNGKLRTISLSDPVFKGLKVTGPKALPATFSWDLAEARAADDELSVMGAFFRLIESVVGEDGKNAIRGRLAEKAPSVKDGGGALMSGVLTDIISAYGMDEGESSASPRS